MFVSTNKIQTIMAQLIDIADVISAIEALEDRNNCGTYDFIEAKSIAYKQVREAVNALKVKEVDLVGQLNGFQNFYAHENGGEFPSAIEIAEHFYELGLKASLVKDFKKTMEE